MEVDIEEVVGKEFYFLYLSKIMFKKIGRNEKFKGLCWGLDKIERYILFLTGLNFLVYDAKLENREEYDSEKEEIPSALVHILKIKTRDPITLEAECFEYCPHTGKKLREIGKIELITGNPYQDELMKGKTCHLF